MDPVTRAIIAELGARLLGYAVTDRQLRIRQIHGHSLLDGGDAQAALGRSIVEYVPELMGSEDLLKQVIRGREVRHELPIVQRSSADGGTLYCRLIDLPLRTAEGRIHGVLHLQEDITDHASLRQRVVQQRNEMQLLHQSLERINRELRTTNAQMQKLDEFRAAFQSITAHEMSTPLTAILGFLELILQDGLGPLTDEQREYLTIVLRAAERLRNIVTGFMNLARIESGQIELVLAPSDLGLLIQETVSLLQLQMQERGQNLAITLEPDLPPVLCDDTRTLEILTNLIQNAIKYTPNGGEIEVSAMVLRDGHYALVSVADSGIGIAKDDQNRLFSRFFRTEEALRRGEYGVGLGLYITHALVELHGGRLWVESEPNQGSVFHFTLPIAAG